MTDAYEPDDDADDKPALPFSDAADIIDLALYHASDRDATRSAAEAFVSPIDVRACEADPACTIPDALNNAMPSRRRLEFLCIAERIVGSPNSTPGGLALPDDRGDTADARAGGGEGVRGGRGELGSLRETSMATTDPATTPASASCSDCKRPYGAAHGFPDLVIPDWAWNRISPTVDGYGLLCPSCLCARLDVEGIRCNGSFTSGPIDSVASSTVSRWVRAAANPATTPAPTPYPALVAMLREWVAQRSDRIHRVYLGAEPGTVACIVIQDKPRPTPAHDPDEGYELSGLECDVMQQPWWPSGVNFSSGWNWVDTFQNHPDLISIDDPDAPAIIADRVRTADDLRAELVRVTAERDEYARALLEMSKWCGLDERAAKYNHLLRIHHA